MVANPDVSVFVLFEASCVKRCEFYCCGIIVQMTVFSNMIGPDHFYPADISSHPECTIIHLQNVINIVIMVIRQSCYL